MLEKPDLEDARLNACLLEAYGLLASQIVFLPLGADSNTAVYRAVADGGATYFVKLRRGIFNETSVALPQFLSDQGITQIIAPVATATGQPSTRLEPFTVIVYPFVEGRNGYEVDMSERHWRGFGAALKRIHTATVPPALTSLIPRETFAAHWREGVRTFLSRVENDAFHDPVAIKVAALLKANRGEVLDLVGRAERLAGALQARAPEFVVCHSDIHAGNILIDGNGDLYIVDWDNPIRAPKERDLMFVGGGQGFRGHTAHEEETLFYQGYGQTRIDSIALAYYRYERIVVDIAVFCEQLLLADEGGDDREQSLEYLESNFLPNGTIEVAYRSDKNHWE